MKSIDNVLEKYIKEGINIYKNGFSDKMDGIRIDNWILDIDSRSGTFMWIRKGFEWVVYATPYWEDAEGVPVAIQNEDDDYISGDDIKYLRGIVDNNGLIKGLSFTGDNDVDRKNYLKSIEKILDLVYKNQTDYHMRMV